MTGVQTKWTAPVVRKTFLNFFEEKGHTVGEWRGNFFLVRNRTPFSEPAIGRRSLAIASMGSDTLIEHI